MEQAPRSPLHPQTAVQLERRLAQHPSKDPVEMEWRQRGTARQRLQVERSVEVCNHLLGRPLHGQLVERSRLGFHRR